jgi:hypothetical protein
MWISDPDPWFLALAGPGGDLLFRALRRSTIGAEGFHGRVRDGIGCLAPRHDHQAGQGPGSGIGKSGIRDPLTARRASSSGACRCVRRAFRPPSDFRRPSCEGDQADRAISTGWLKALPPFHFRPIDVMVCHGSWARPGFEGGFPLRCFQRLSRPHLATRRCGRRHNRYTRGASIPVLSY